MHPELFHLGPIHLRSFGTMMAIAFLVGTWLSMREAKRLGLDEDKLVNVILVTLVCSVIGARLLYVLEHLEDFRRSWGSVLALWQGGLTLYGGIVAGTFGGLLAAQRMGLPRWRVADALTPGLAIGTMFGRIGCFLNGCCYGHPTTLPWGVKFPPSSFAALEFGDTPVHPSQLYNAGASLVIFAVLWASRKRLGVPGVLFWTFLVVYSIVRVPIDFTRSYEPAAVILHAPFDITESQAMSFAIALFGAFMILRLRREAAGAPSMPAA
jgi:phosphatidylglycerol:prolipoprotein diacylglycerol transferase